MSLDGRVEKIAFDISQLPQVKRRVQGVEKEKVKIPVASLCCGTEGIRAWWGRLEHFLKEYGVVDIELEWVWCVEADYQCRRWLSKAYPGITIFKKLENMLDDSVYDCNNARWLDQDAIPRPLIILAGIHCGNYSNLNNYRGMARDSIRNKLKKTGKNWDYVLALAVWFAVMCIFIENVKELMNGEDDPAVCLS